MDACHRSCEHAAVPRPRRQRARYGPPSVEKLLGALPVVASFCQRLDLQGIVDRACPVREVATLTHGQVIAALGLEVARLHWDMTSISVYGVYEEPEDGFIAPRFGHPKDRRPDLKQVQTGLAVSGDGGVPVFHRAYDGGAGEVAQVAGAMRALGELAGERRFLLVGDSKLVSTPTCATSWPPR